MKKKYPKKEKIQKAVKQKSIRTTLFTGFLFPVLMILVLGIVSYATAGQTIKNKYEESSLNTITAMSMYADTLTSGLASRALEQLSDPDLKQYYEVYYDNTAENWFDYYQNAKNQLLHIFNSTSYLENYYVIPEVGSVMSSPRTEWGPNTYTEFMSSDIGQSFASNIAKKNGWFGYHTSIDTANGSTGEEYAFTYVQKFLTSNVYLLFDWSMDSVESMLEEIDFGENSISALISSDGREIARRRTVDTEGSDVLEIPTETIFLDTEFYQESLELKEAYSDYVRWNGDTYLYIYSPIGKTEISLCSLVPQKNIVSEVSTIRNLTILIVAIAAAIAIVLGNHLAGGI